jgi:RNA polymerase sigma factor (sigma-70 family)
MLLPGDDRYEDVVAEVFVGLWFFPTKFDPRRGTLLSYLRVKARSRCIDIVRMETARRRREVAVFQLPIGSAELVENRVLGSEFALALRDGMSRLPAPERESIELAFFSGLSYDAVAAQLGIPEGTVKGRIRNGLRRLRANSVIRVHYGVEEPP